MAIAHAESGQFIDIRPLGGKLAESRTVALFKTGELEVMRLVLTAGKSMLMHSVKGEITVQCLEGEVELAANGQARRMKTGQLVWLAGGVKHALTALIDASVLVTISLRK